MVYIDYDKPAIGSNYLDSKTSAEFSILGKSYTGGMFDQGTIGFRVLHRRRKA
jgi:hypothetical protein